MDEFFFLFLVILVPIFIIGILISLSIWIYKILRKKNINPKWRIFAFIPLIMVGYFVYDALYPSSEFYEKDFKEVTGTELPENSEFKYKIAGYPDQHGDYSSVSIIKVGTEFYKELQSSLTKNGLVENGQIIGCKEMEKQSEK